MSSRSEYDALLGALEHTLEQESTALRSLDRQTLDRLTDEKLTLHEQLLQLRARLKPTPEVRARAERVKALALQNQLLLVHARDCVRSVLQLAAGTTAHTTYAPIARPTAPPLGGSATAVRVSYRG